MIPLGLLAVVWTLPAEKNPLLVRVRNLLQFLGAFILVTLALNPLFWRHPIQAAQASWGARRSLMIQQVQDFSALRPEIELDSPLERGASILANLYLTPPSFAEAGNYHAETTPYETAYLTMPGHMLFRAVIPAGLLMIFTLFGITVFLIRRWESQSSNYRLGSLYLLGAGLQLTALTAAVPLPFQRYAVPLVPFSCIWLAYGINAWVDPVRNIARRVTRPQNAAISTGGRPSRTRDPAA
jgi:hypothetical protein